MALQVVRNSERKDFLRCQTRWHWAWKEGLRPRTGTKLHFWFGTGVHEALAFWYGLEGTERGPDPRETWLAYCERERHNLIKEESADDEHFYTEIVHLGTEMFRGYLDTYGDDPDIQVIVPERSFQALVRRPDGVQVRVVGTFDLLYYDKRTGRLWIGEHKTAKVIKTTHLRVDNQAGLYISVGEHIAKQEGFIGKKDRLMGINYNYLRKSIVDPEAVFDAEGFMLKKPLKRHYGEALGFDDKSLAKFKLDELEVIAQERGLTVVGDRAATQPSAYFHREEITRTRKQRKSILGRVGQEALWMEQAESGNLPLLKNFTNDCDWDCDFYLMCIAHENEEDWLSFRDAVFTITDPYKDHRKAA